MGAGHPTTKTRIWRPNTATRPQIHHPHPPPPNTPRKTPNRSRAIGSTRFTGGLHLDLPIPAVGLEAEEANVGRVDGVLVVNPDEAVGLEGGEDFTQGADVDERRSSAQADFGLAARRHEAIDVVGIDHPLLTA
jgi:hypothetical protein